MRMLIIPTDIAEKLRNTDFGKWDKLDPVKGILDGKDVCFLPEDLKYIKTFEKALADFEVCEVKEIETIKTKFFDKEVEILPTKTTIQVKGVPVEQTKYYVKGVEKGPFELTAKIILTVAK